MSALATIDAVVAEAVPGGEIQQVRDQLPDGDGWEELFELVDAGADA